MDENLVTGSFLTSERMSLDKKLSERGQLMLEGMDIIM